MNSSGELGLILVPHTCGTNMPGGAVILPTPPDGAETLLGDPNCTLVESTESPLAPKDVLVMVTHGNCGVNGATSAIIKYGKENIKVMANALAEVLHP